MARPTPPGTITPAALKAWPTIVGAVSQGVSSRGLERILRNAGTPVRRQDLLDAMRQVTGEARAAESLRFIRKDRQPDPRRLPQAATRTLRTYSFSYRVTAESRVTGQQRTSYVTVSSSTLRTVAELDARAAELAEDVDGSDRGSVLGVVMIGARTRGPLGTIL